MKPVYFRLALFVLLLSLAAACSHSNSGDPVDTPVGTTDTNRFWIFPNPGKDPLTGVYTTNDASYAQAYYTTMDPSNQRDTLAKFQAMHGFGGGGGTEVSVVFRDTYDLGYGRRLTVRRYQNSGSPTNGLDANTWVIAAYVENYQVVPFAGDDYTGLNLEAAIKVDRSWHVGTNAIEYSTVGGKTFTKFFTYSPSGVRLNTVNLDGRGEKAMPSVCINCHGGRADPLTAAGAFPRGGDTWGRMQPLNVGSFEFWGSSPYQRVDQEASLKLINQMVLCTYPLGAASAQPEDSCRPVYDQAVNLSSNPYSSNVWLNGWQSASAEMIKAWYGGDGMPNASFADNYVPTGWQGSAADISLYQNVVAPYCRACHVARGTGNQSDIDFTSSAKFTGYADRIKAHVFDRGNMPLGLLIYNRFWNSNAPQQLADWLVTIDPAYNPVRVGGGTSGTPVRPSGALVDPVLSAGIGATRFSDIRTQVLQDATLGCTGCHNNVSDGQPFGSIPPIYYTDYSRGGTPGTAGDATYAASSTDDDYWFYLELRGRINFTDVDASPLLRKPSGYHHAGGPVLDLNSTTPCTNVQPCWAYGSWAAYYLAKYNLIRDWILDGAPY